MEIYAGFMAQVDSEVGRILDAFRDAGQIDNTLVMYIAGDNGASLEGTLTGTDNIMEQVNGFQPTAADVLKHLDDLGGPLSNPHYPAGWAWAGNTPFQWGKRIGSHLGGTRDPLVISWPAAHQGQRRHATAVPAPHRRVPDRARGGRPAASAVRQRRRPATGERRQLPRRADEPVGARASRFPVLRDARQPCDVQRRLGGRAADWLAAMGVLRSDGAQAPPAWELYDLEHDHSEARDLAGARPDKLEELKALFDRAAIENNVYPLDSRVNGRQHPNPPPPGGRDFYTFYPGVTHLFDALAPGDAQPHAHVHGLRGDTGRRRRWRARGGGRDGVGIHALHQGRSAVLHLQLLPARHHDHCVTQPASLLGVR